MQSFMILLPLLTIVQAGQYGNIQQTSAANLRHNSDDSDIQQIANILHPRNSNIAISKEIFTFSPPDAELNDDIADVPESKDILLRRRFRIIFIRSPDASQNLSNAIAKLAKTKSEQKTVIYVLTKHTDLNALTSKWQQVSQDRREKPEVHFVKYRTTAEAENAMKNIQQQYETLGGKSRVHGAQLAPVVNFAAKKLQ